MLDPIVDFITGIFERIGRWIGWLIAWLLWPFIAISRWYTRRGWIVRGAVGLVILVWLGAYLHFFWQTQRWVNFNPDYVSAYDMGEQKAGPGEAVPGSSGVCGTSAIVEVAADLADYNVNQNTWIPSMLLSKAGFFTIPWRHTPFFDNKAAFELGINQVLRRTTVELVDTLGRVRGTSQIDEDLQKARSAFAYNEEYWYFSWTNFNFVTPTPKIYRGGIGNLRTFNDRLGHCQATFDPRADNLVQFLDRVAGDIGSTSDILRGRIEQSNAGWFDPRADDRFWFAYGQLYAYYGILTAARSDFNRVFVERSLTNLWDRTADQLRSALNIQPFIISNGGESAWIMPSHLATMGFYLLRVRSNLVEMRSVLDR